MAKLPKKFVFLRDKPDNLYHGLSIPVVRIEPCHGEITLKKMRKYNIVNNTLGWLCFVVAAVTYLCTIEPTASFWDCPEFILQGAKLEIGHPPGNPIFMLAARFFINFTGDITQAAVAVNCMSALLSAGTILLLFWTVTHLVKRLVVRDDATVVTLPQLVLIMGAGLCGALAYTWSDTFWFSAVEGEVYAFSSFCTALVFWLILKWQNRADNPGSDRYLLLIAYVIGVSIAVHLLNLLCIPAVALVIYYTKYKDTNAKGSLIALCISAVVVALILYGLVPGFVKMAQQFELIFVNGLHTPYNTGTLVYAAVLVASFIWGIHAVYSAISGANATPQRNTTVVQRVAILLPILLSGVLMVGMSTWLIVLLMIAVVVWMFWRKKLPLRLLSLSLISMLVIFVGYSSYALLLIRSSASTPMNQNAPDNVFDLASYLNREQYGERPLLYGQVFSSKPVYDATGHAITKEGATQYGKVVKSDASQPDEYIETGKKTEITYTPELNMVFPRMYDSSRAQGYIDWTNMQGNDVEGTLMVDDYGNTIQTELMKKPTVGENLRYFIEYQLNWMYWRYFMWNFAGRQNDIQGEGQPNYGNWISGIPFIDNPRLGDQSLLPYDEGEGNKGHNVFYMLPLLMGIIGLCWQAFHSKRGIEQFWVVFFLFFMTGIAIVLYLNQPPGQPRERDYAYAGSFYAFAIWIGLGVPGLKALLSYLFKGKKQNKAGKTEEKEDADGITAVPWQSWVALAMGIFVPLQMVSQTWDDHDRSGRYTARDFAFNYLNSLEPNAVIFTNGDNDTFPLWYAQEVEGVRTDVKVVNQSYLTAAWYIDMMKKPSYEAAGLKMLAPSEAYAHDRMQVAFFDNNLVPNVSADAYQVLDNLYRSKGEPTLSHHLLSIPVDLDKAVEKGRLTPAEAGVSQNQILADLYQGRGYAPINSIITTDILATSMRNGWDRPIYFAVTVPNDMYVNLEPYMRRTGLAYEVTPLATQLPESGSIRVDTERAYKTITEKYRWGGLDAANTDRLYLDETVRRMVSTMRISIIETAQALIEEAAAAEATGDQAQKTRKLKMAGNLLELMERKLPAKVSPYSIPMVLDVATLYWELGTRTNSAKFKEHAQSLLLGEIDRVGQMARYQQSLNPRQFNTLASVDIYATQTYLPQLVLAYGHTGGSMEQVLQRLSAAGVATGPLLQNLQEMLQGLQSDAGEEPAEQPES